MPYRTVLSSARFHHTDSTRLFLVEPVSVYQLGPHKRACWNNLHGDCDSQFTASSDTGSDAEFTGSDDAEFSTEPVITEQQPIAQPATTQQPISLRALASRPTSEHDTSVVDTNFVVVNPMAHQHNPMLTHDYVQVSALFVLLLFAIFLSESPNTVFQ